MLKKKKAKKNEKEAQIDFICINHGWVLAHNGLRYCNLIDGICNTRKWIKHVTYEQVYTSIHSSRDMGKNCNCFQRMYHEIFGYWDSPSNHLVGCFLL